MRVKIYLIIITVLSLVFIAGCKTSDELDPDNNNPSNGTNMVDVLDSSFSPSTITVSVGTTVTWTHKGNAVHTVTSGTRGNANGVFNSGDMTNGNTFQFTFNTAGTFDYHCIYHNGMNGTVIVQ